MLVKLYKAWTRVLPFIRRSGISVIEIGKSSSPNTSMPMMTYQFNMQTQGSDLFQGCIVRSAQMLLCAVEMKRGSSIHNIEEWFNEADGKYSFDKFLEARDEECTMRWWSASDAMIAITNLCTESQITVSNDEDEIEHDGTVLVYTVHLDHDENGLTQESVDQLVELSTHPKFIGAVGGVGNKGFMFTNFGQDKSELIDPHAMITDASFPLLTVGEYKNLFSLADDEMFMVDTRRISPSICVCFA